MKNLRQLATSLLLTAALGAVPVGATVINQVVLRINSQIVTLDDYRQALTDRQRAILGADLPDERRQQLLESAGTAVYRDLYEELLLRARADQIGFTPSRAQVEAAVQTSMERMGIRNESELEQALAANGMTREQLQETLSGTIATQEVVAREVQSLIQIEDEELRRIYRQDEARHTEPAALRLQELVVLGDPAFGGDELAGRAQAYRQRLEAGDSLAEVAAAGAEAGETSDLIDLDWVEEGHLSPELGSAAWGLAEGGYSAPIEGRGGLHILHLVERRDAQVRPFEEVRELILRQERQRRTAKSYHRYIRELEGQAYIVMNLPAEAAGFTGFEPLDETAFGDEAEDGEVEAEDTLER